MTGIENSMVAFATEEYERQNGEPSWAEVIERAEARASFICAILMGKDAAGKNGLYCFDDILATMPKPFADEFHWADDSIIFRFWVDGAIPEWHDDFRKQAHALADTAIGEALE